MEIQEEKLKYLLKVRDALQILYDLGFNKAHYAQALDFVNNQIQVCDFEPLLELKF